MRNFAPAAPKRRTVTLYDMSPPPPGFRRPPPPSAASPRRAHFALQIAGLAASSHLLWLAASALPGFDDSGLARLPDAMPLSSPGEILRAVCLFAVIPALVEESVFRGLVFAGLERLGGLRLAIGGSAVLFGLAHFDPHHALVATALGLQLGAMRQVYGLGLAIAAHLTNNLLALAAFAASTALGAEPPLPSEPAADATQPLALALTLATALLATLLAGSACAVLAQRLRSSPLDPESAPTALQPLAQRDD